MNNPYQYLEEYIGQEMTYKEFCEIMKIEPLLKMQKTRQIKEFGNYMDIETRNGNVLISNIYNQDEMLFVQRNAKFKEYFENLMILWLNEQEGYYIDFTYSEIERFFCMVNENYKKYRFNRSGYISDNKLSVKGNAMDFDKEDLQYETHRNVDLFFNITDRLMKQIIDNVLESMQSRSLIMYSESYRLYKSVWVKEVKDFRTIVLLDCNDEQNSEIIDIKKKAMDKFKLKKKQDVIFLGFKKRQEYYDYINEEIKSSPNLGGADYYGKLFKVTIGKEGMKIESDKIDRLFNNKMFNTNLQYKFLTGSELQCVNNILKGIMVSDLISK